MPLTAAAFAPFGDVLEAPPQVGRATFDGALANLRVSAKISLSLVHKLPTALPLESETMERHRWSSQTFLPLSAYRWLVVVAPHRPSHDAPDMTKARAFLASGHQGVTYGADVWHHPFVVLDQPAQFAVATWKDGSSEDDEFVSVPPFAVRLS
ncbi:MAG: ureidoglycolate lyase [Variibacter sp.]